MFENLKNNYPALSDFFETLISQRNYSVPNSIILHGPDVIAQYYFAMMLARGANCEGEKTDSCSCQNCRWIKNNEHPEIMTVSKIDSKPDGDDSKTVISVKQIDNIKDKLISSSDYHRFFIFCDAEDRDISIEEKDKFSKFDFLNIKLPQNVKKQWIPLGLTQKCFTDIVANALLKSIEEPPFNVTFIFLTENIENIISTVVSRSQAFYVSGSSKHSYDFEFLKEPLSNYPNIENTKAIMISDFLMKYSKDNDKNMSYIVSSIQVYLTELLKHNSNNLIFKKRILNDISKLQDILFMLKSSVKEQIIADEVGFILTAK